MKVNVSRLFKDNELYRAMWRWHFYIGVLVLPVLLMLCASGLLMLASKPIDAWMDRELTTVLPQNDPLAASALAAKVAEHYPQATLQMYMPPLHSSESARFAITDIDAAGAEQAATVYVNPFSGNIIGSHDPSDNLYETIKEVHSTLLLGRVGNLLVEGAAGLAIVLVISGLYLSWSRYSRDRGTNHAGDRRRWRYWHKLSGWLVAFPLLLFLFTGLAWTSIWGVKIVQPWGSVPSTTYDAPAPEHSYSSLNQNGVRQMPWALEQTPMPHAQSVATSGIGLDDVVVIAQQQGFKRYRVHLPHGENNVWTLTATTMAGDLTNPFNERILHLNPNSGEPLAEITFADYPVMGKAMAGFIPLHQGDLGLWNLLFNMSILLLVLFLMLSGFVLWYKRRAPHKRALQAPPVNPTTSKIIAGIMLLIALCFPVSAVLLLLVIIADLWSTSRKRWV